MSAPACLLPRRAVLLRAALGLLLLPAAGRAERIAAYGWVSAGERITTVALPLYQGSPQIVSELLVREGEAVEAGQRLALTNLRALAETEHKVARARLATAEARAQAQKTRPKPSPTADELAALQAEAGEARAGVARAEALQALTEVKAPVAGTVLRVLAGPGETAAAGLLELGETQAPLIKAELPVGEAAKVQPGAAVAITSEAWAGEKKGEVARLSPLVQRSTLSVRSTFANVDRQVVEATIRLAEGSAAGLRAGTPVTVLITPAPAQP